MKHLSRTKYKTNEHSLSQTNEYLCTQELINPYPANVDNMASSYQC